MIFVPVPDVSSPAVVTLGAIIVSLVFTISVSIIMSETWRWKGYLIFASICILVTFISVSSGFQWYKDTQEMSAAAWAERVDEAQNIYGLKVSEEDLRALGYPPSEPSEVFEVYNTTQVTTKTGERINQQTVTLIWDDGEMQLFGGEGAVQTLEELPRR